MQPRVLVLDSDQAHAASCLVMLEQAGFSVELASRFEEAVLAMRRTRPDALIVEAVVEGGDSSAIVRDAARRGVPAFSMSDLALGPVNEAFALRALGAASHWEKPLHREDVMRDLRRALGDAFPSRGVAVPAAPPVAETPRPDVHESPTVERTAAPLDGPSAPEFHRESELGDDEHGDLGDEPTDITRAPVAAAPTVERAVAVAAPAGAASDTPTAGSAATTTEPAPQAPEAVPPGAAFAPPGERVVGRSTSIAPLTVVCAWLGRGGDGVLELDGAAGSIALRLRAGALIGVRVPGRRDPVLAMLRDDGVVRDDQWDAIARNFPAEAHSADLLVEAGLLDEASLAAASEASARRELCTWWAADDIGWAWRAGATDVPDGGFELMAPRLAWEAATHALEPSLLLRALEDVAPHPLAWTDRPLRRDAMPLTRAQRAVLASVDGATPAASILADEPAGAAMLYALASLGSVKRA